MSRPWATTSSRFCVPCAPTGPASAEGSAAAALATPAAFNSSRRVRPLMRHLPEECCYLRALGSGCQARPTAREASALPSLADRSRGRRLHVELDLVTVGVANAEAVGVLAERLEAVGHHLAPRGREILERLADLERDVIEARHAFRLR